MQDITWNIVIGVVAGLLTASVLLTLKSLFMNSFLPWYKQLIYSGLDLSGSWHSLGSSQKMLLEIKQTSEKLVGRATVHLLKESFQESEIDALHLDDIRTFDVIGEISERFVNLRLKHTDPTRIGVVTYLLLIDGDGTKLSGHGCWYSPLATTISSGIGIFYRDESRAVKSIKRTKAKLEDNSDLDTEDLSNESYPADSKA